MDKILEYRVQSVFVLLFGLVIIYGIVATGVTIKAATHTLETLDLPVSFHWLSRFVKHAGFLFFIIPILWAWGTIRYENSGRPFPKWVTFGSGLVVLVWLWETFSTAAVLPIMRTL